MDEGGLAAGRNGGLLGLVVCLGRNSAAQGCLGASVLVGLEEGVCRLLQPVHLLIPRFC